MGPFDTPISIMQSSVCSNHKVTSAYEPSGPSGQCLISSFSITKVLELIRLPPLDGMVVQHRVTAPPPTPASIKFLVSFSTLGGREALFELHVSVMH